jgi:hypothetical protein
MRRTTLTLAVFGVLCVVNQAGAQTSAKTSTAPGAFVGTIKNSLDKSPVKAADIRLYFVDSGHVSKDALGISSVDTFIDTTRSRLGFTDSTGNFAIWHLASGKYLMNIRRIGFTPVEAVVTVDTETVIFDYAMDPNSQMLSKVEIVEAASTSASRRLDNVGFDRRAHSGSGQFLKQADILKKQPQTIRDILQTYGLSDNADYELDRMSLDFDDIQDYPAEFVAGIEIYRHNRPVESNMTRGPVTRGRTLGRRPPPAPSGATLTRPLVRIWTAFPG